MKPQLYILAAILLGLSACTTTPSQPALPDKERYADELMAIVPPSVMIAQLSDSYASAYPLPHKKSKARAAFMSHVDTEKVDRIVRDALLKHFSESELKALVAFYSTPEGRSCMTKVAPFAAEVVPACSREATDAFSKTAVDAARKLLLP